MKPAEGIDSTGLLLYEHSLCSHLCQLQLHRRLQMVKVANLFILHRLYNNKSSRLFIASIPFLVFLYHSSSPLISPLSSFIIFHLSFPSLILFLSSFLTYLSIYSICEDYFSSGSKLCSVFLIDREYDSDT